MGNVELLRKELIGPIIQGISPVTHNREDIIKSYFREILFLAKKFVRPTVDFEDLVVEGLIGLMDACERFDPERSKAENAFHNLAILRIKSQMYEFYLANFSQYNVPNYMARLISQVEQIRNLLQEVEYPGDREQDLRTSGESEALLAHAPADLLENIRYLKERIARIAKNSGKSYEEMVAVVLKLEADVESAAAQEEASVPSPEEEVANREFLEKFLANLKPDAREVVTHRLAGETLTQVGEESGFTRERARQIQEEAIEHLKKTRLYRDAVD